MVRITIQHINKTGTPLFPAKVTKVYVEENIKDAAQAGIVDRFTDKNPHRRCLDGSGMRLPGTTWSRAGGLCCRNFFCAKMREKVYNKRSKDIADF